VEKEEIREKGNIFKITHVALKSTYQLFER